MPELFCLSFGSYLLGTTRMAFTYDSTPFLEIGNLRTFRATQEMQLAQLCNSGILLFKVGTHVWLITQTKKRHVTDVPNDLFLCSLAHFRCRISRRDCQCGDSVNVPQSVLRSATGFTGQTERRGRCWAVGSPSGSCGMSPHIL